VVSARLRERRLEIEEAILARVYAISDPSLGTDLEYVEGLRAAVSAATGYGLDGIENGLERPASVPAVLLVQARLAAQNEIGLDTVLRRYFAGYALLTDFLIEEFDGSPVQGGGREQLLSAQASLFDSLIVTVSEEHRRGAQAHLGISEQHQAKRVQRLLKGEPLDVSRLGYELGGFHLGALAVGPSAGEAFCGLARELDRHLLLVHREDAIVWAWLGGRRAVDLEELERSLSSTWPSGVPLAIGESGEGLPGWRLTHRQAKAALPVAIRGARSVVRYPDVAVLASLLQDEALATCLRRRYLAPLANERDGGETLRLTLRAYFLAGCNASSAAAALGVKRHTVTNRIRAIENRLGLSLGAHAAEVELVLRLEGLGEPKFPHCAT
jgi:hypothetical protein